MTIVNGNGNSNLRIKSNIKLMETITGKHTRQTYMVQDFRPFKYGSLYSSGPFENGSSTVLYK